MGIPLNKLPKVFGEMERHPSFEHGFTDLLFSQSAKMTKSDKVLQNLAKNEILPRNTALNDAFGTTPKNP